MRGGSAASIGVLAVLLVGLGWSEPARAQASEADTLFTEGRELLAKGRWAEACDKLQKSERLAPATGTLLNLGFCWEQLARMRSAMDAYAEAEILATQANDAKSATFARERFAFVEAKVMKLVIRVEHESTRGLEVTRNGQPVPKTDWGKPIAVDPEDFVVAASAPGYATWRGVVTGKGDAAVVTVVVPELQRASRLALVPDIGMKRGVALGLGGLSAIALGASVALGVSAKSRYNDASPFCDASGCDAAGTQMKSSAVGQGNVATALAFAGIVCLGAGIYLWITGDSEKEGAAARHARISRAGSGVAFW
jgi:hypothetical protein